MTRSIESLTPDNNKHRPLNFHHLYIDSLSRKLLNINSLIPTYGTVAAYKKMVLVSYCRVLGADVQKNKGKYIKSV